MRVVLHKYGEIIEVIENAKDVRIDRSSGSVFTDQENFTGLKCEITVLDDDEPPENALSLDKYKYEKIAALNEACEETILAGFYCAATGHTYGFSSYDQANLTQQYTRFVYNPDAEPVDWKTEDAGVVPHMREDFLAVCDAADAHKRGNIKQYWTLKEQVLAATMREEIDAIQWTPWEPTTT